MSKSKLTIEIENALFKRFKGTGYRYANEVVVTRIYNGKKQWGICDFVTSKTGDSRTYGLPEIGCYEIKISISDFKSKNGHSLFGDVNYYVMPKELFDEILKKNANLIMGEFGIMTYKDGTLRKAREFERSLYYSYLSIEERFQILDSILQRWVSGKVNQIYENKEE